MKAHSFVHDHYSTEVGELPPGHAAAMLGGLVMMVAGLGLSLTVALLPVGLVVGLLGLSSSAPERMATFAARWR